MEDDGFYPVYESKRQHFVRLVGSQIFACCKEAEMMERFEPTQQEHRGIKMVAVTSDPDKVTLSKATLYQVEELLAQEVYAEETAQTTKEVAKPELD